MTEAMPFPITELEDSSDANSRQSTAGRSVERDGHMLIELFVGAEQAEEESDQPNLDKSVGRSHEKDSVGSYLDNLYRSGKQLLSAEQEVDLARRIEAGLAAAAMLDGRMERRLDATDEELAWLEDDGAQSKLEFMEKNVRLPVSIARKYAFRATNSMQMADFISEGNAGMIRAVEKFDYQQGYKFSTYATWWIRQAIGRAISDQSRTIRIPVHTVEKINAMRRLQSEFLAAHDREPTDEELAYSMDIDIEKLGKLKDAARTEPLSFNKSIDDDGAELGDLIVGEDGREYLDALVQMNISKEQILAAIDSLDMRSAEVIRRRFGFRGNEETLDRIGQRFDTSRENIRILEKKALAKLALRLQEAGVSERPINPRIIGANGVPGRKGRPHSFNVAEMIESGRNILDDDTMKMLLTVDELGTLKRAAEALSISNSTLNARLKSVRRWLENPEANFSVRKGPAAKQLGKRARHKQDLLRQLESAEGLLSEDDLAVVRTYVESPSMQVAASEFGVSLSTYQKQYGLATAALSALGVGQP